MRLLAISLVSTTGLLACGGKSRVHPPESVECELTLGTPQRIVETDWHPFAVDGGHVYFAADDELRRVPVTGGEPEVIYSGTAPGRVTTITPHVYWTDGDVLLRAPLTGGSTEAVIEAPDFGPYDLLDDTLYWAESRRTQASGPALPIGVYSDSQRIATVEGGGGSTELFADSAALFLLNTRAVDPSSLYRLERIAHYGAVTTLASGPGLTDVAFADGTLFWLDGERVLALDVAGSVEPRVAADSMALAEADTSRAHLRALAADGQRLFYAGFWFGEQSRALVVGQCHEGGLPSGVEIDTEPRWMAVDDDAVYVGGEAVWRIPFETRSHP